MLMFSFAAFDRLRVQRHDMIEERQARTPDVGRATTLDGLECSGRRSMSTMISISEKGLTPDVCTCQLKSCPGPGTQEEVKAVVCDAEVVPLFPKGLPW